MLVEDDDTVRSERSDTDTDGDGNSDSDSDSENERKSSVDYDLYRTDLTDVFDAQPMCEDTPTPKHGMHMYIPILYSLTALIDRGTFKLSFYKEHNEFASYLSPGAKPHMYYTLLDTVAIVYSDAYEYSADSKVNSTDSKVDKKKHFAVYRIGTKQRINICVPEHLTKTYVRILALSIDYHMQQSCEWKEGIDMLVDKTIKTYRVMWSDVARRLREHGIVVPSMDSHMSSMLRTYNALTIEGMVAKELLKYCKDKYDCSIFGVKTNFLSAENVDVCPLFLREYARKFAGEVASNREKVRKIFANVEGRPLIRWEDYGIHRNMSTSQLIVMLFRDHIFVKALRSLSIYYRLSSDDALYIQVIVLREFTYLVARDLLPKPDVAHQST